MKTDMESVGFTGAAGFILAFLWLISFDLALGIHLCCGWEIDIKDKRSNHSQRICLILLIMFTVAAARLALFVVAGVMLILALTGLVLSLLGSQHAILVFVITGWLLAATTSILCGVFMILNNAISDTCMAMGEWVENPLRIALSDVLTCVDQRTTNKTLIQSQHVVTNIANVVNQFIYTTATQIHHKVP